MRKKKDAPQAVTILLLNDLLRRQRLTLRELMARFGVSERTMYRYFDYFESAQIDIEKDFHRRYFIPTY